ncbi:anthranilate synthase component 1 [Basidiobolus ranarum]|uniref:anthranilate synthase n=1 Tax=Basidiobolus ranarum TaxID=34480 RepID=A0ABR2WXJ3_9FUNG
MQLDITPTYEEVKELISSGKGNTVPVYHALSADLSTPVSTYLKLRRDGIDSFLLESVTGGEKIGRYSFISFDAHKVIKTGDKEKIQGDPLVAVENELKNAKFISVPGLPSFTGGAIGYISYDCIKYFEPRTARDLEDTLEIPESIFLFCDTMVIFDHLHHLIKIVSHIKCDADNLDSLEGHYSKARAEISEVMKRLNEDTIPLPEQPPIKLNQSYTSNVGKEGYEHFVTNLKEHIIKGDIIQAVPSQRLARPTTLHPFNAYRHLRTVNPAPYMFYFDFHDFHVVGASPEMLVKVENNIVYTHPIAGTRKRGKTQEEDDALAADLLADEKEVAEHVMLVDLGRNDVNRVCRPETVKVDSLMQIERYSHVMHIVSNVSGELREDQTPFDAFRSIFPAGTVSGAPKIRAIELVGELEKEKRGIYAGAVGHFSYSGDLDTCISIRTMVFKDGVAYLQAGAGIVYDSVPEKEHEETMTKLMSNMTAITQAEKHYYNLQQQA